MEPTSPTPRQCAWFRWGNSEHDWCVTPFTGNTCFLHRLEIAAGPEVAALATELDIRLHDDGAPKSHDARWLAHLIDVLITWPAYGDTKILKPANPPMRQDRHQIAELALGPGWETPRKRPKGVTPAGTVRPISERTRAMLADYDAGSTLQQIGDRYGLSRERVRQILAPHRSTRGVGRYRRPLDPIEVAVVLRDTLENGWREGTGSEKIRKWLNGFSPSPLIAPTIRNRNTPFDLDAERATWIAEVREAAAEMGEPLRQDDFDAWARKHGRRGHQMHYLTGWTWGQLCDHAGLSVTVVAALHQGPRSDRYWTTKRCSEAIDRFVRRCIADNMKPSLANYSLWAEHEPEAPSLPTLRARYHDASYRIAQRARGLLVRHFAEAMEMLESGRLINPTSYVGPFSSLEDLDEDMALGGGERRSAG